LIGSSILPARRDIAAAGLETGCGSIFHTKTEIKMTKLSDLQSPTIKDIGRGFFTDVAVFNASTLTALEKRGLISIKTFKTVPSRVSLTKAGRKVFKTL